VEAATKRAATANINVALPSPTVTLKVTPAPITLGAVQPATVKAGAAVELPVAITRLYGFADAVTVKVKAPEAAKGLKVADVAIAANQPDGKLKVETAADTPPGAYTLTVQALAKFNGQELSVTRDVVVTVEAAEAAK
jgi:hypothetical protein